jgi:hypothetical protein
MSKNLAKLAKSARELFSRIREYEAYAASEDHRFTIEAKVLLISASFAALTVEQELRQLGFGPEYPFVGEANAPGASSINTRAPSASEYPFAGEANAQVPVVSGPWPCETFVAISTLRRFLHEARGGESGYAKRASGQWCLPPLGTRLGEKVMPDFTFWLGRLEGAVAALEPGHPDPDNPGENEEWVPATVAVERAEKAGRSITLPWLSKSAAKCGVRTRPRKLKGRHQLEVEWNSLAGYLLSRDSRNQPAGEETSGELSEEEIERRIAKANKAKRDRRSLD